MNIKLGFAHTLLGLRWIPFMATLSTGKLIQSAHLSSFYYELQDEELFDLAREYHANENLIELTGLFIYREGCMFSIVEGPEDVIDLYYRNVHQSTVQHSIIAVFHKCIDKRDFTYLNFAFKTYEFSKSLSLKLNAGEKPFCSQGQIQEFEELVQRSHFENLDQTMSNQISNLIKTFQRTILRYDPPQHQRHMSNIWSRPTLSRSNTQTSEDN